MYGLSHIEKLRAEKVNWFDQVRHFQGDLEGEAKSAHIHSSHALSLSSEIGGVELAWEREWNPDNNTNFKKLFH